MVYLLCGLLFLAIFSRPAVAQNSIIVMHSLGLSGLRLTCLLLGCNVIEETSAGKVLESLF